MTSENLAAIFPGGGKVLEVTSCPVNHPAKGEVLIRNYAVAVQPLDAKMLLTGYGGAVSLNYPAILGTSGAGIVEELGEDVSLLRIGDRVVFDTQAYVKGGDANRREGTWQQLVICGAETVAKIGGLEFEQAVLIDFPLQTAVVALHLFLGMGKPGTGNSKEKVLIWGAGGAVGSYAVQYAKSVGYELVVTASAKDVDRQKRLGASEVVDYKAPDVVDRLRLLGPYKYLFTASGDLTSQKTLVSLLGSEGGRFASVLGGDVKLPSNVERVYLPFSQALQKDQYSGLRSWWYGDYLPKVLQERLVEAVKFTKREGGLPALQQASADVFEGKIRGKLVLNPQE